MGKCRSTGIDTQQIQYISSDNKHKFNSNPKNTVHRKNPYAVNRLAG